MNKKSTLGMVLTSWLFFLTGLYAYLSKQYVFAIVRTSFWVAYVNNASRNQYFDMSFLALGSMGLKDLVFWIF